MSRHRDLYYVCSLVRRTIGTVLLVDREYSLLVSTLCSARGWRHTSGTLWEDCSVDSYLMSNGR